MVYDPSHMTPPNPPGYPPPGGGYPPPGYQQQPPPGYPPGMPPQPAPPPKKSNVLMWVLIGVGGFVLLLILAAGAGSYFLYRTVKNAGFDAALMQRNPGLAMAKMVTAMNPDYQTVSTNDSSGTITVREKSTGKVITLRFDPEKKTMVIVGEDGQEAKISVSGDSTNGGVEIQGPDGTVRIGATAGNAAPAWVPAYPGSATQGVGSSQTPEGSAYSYAFNTPDSTSKVIAYFQDALKTQGFTVNQVVTTGQGGMLQAEDSAKKHSVVLIIGSSNDGTSVSVTAVEKK
jgi:hypothetical protein